MQLSVLLLLWNLTTPQSRASEPESRASECDTPKAEWLFCDDFETDRFSKYFEYDNAKGSFTRIARGGIGNSWGMRATFAAGQVNAGSLKLAFGKTPSKYFRPVDAGTALYRELYWRVYLRHEPGWTGGGGDKLSRAQILASDSWAQAMAAPVWSGGQPATWNYLVLDPVRGTDALGTLVTTKYNDFPNQKYIGVARGSLPLFDSNHVGRWYCIEAHVRLNDAGKDNGIFEFWIDDQVQASRTTLNWIGRFSAYGLNAVFFENYWNSGSPKAQSRFMDNIVVSTARIGCSGAAQV